jgi:hypothetical protein
MTWLIVIGAVLLALVVMNLLPVAVDAAYESKAFSVDARMGPVKFFVRPRVRKIKKKVKLEQEKLQEEVQKGKTDLNDLLPYGDLALRTLKRFLRHLRIDRLRIHFIAGGSDPYETAMVYIGAGTAMEAVQDMAGKRVRELDLQAGTDFDAASSVADARICLSVRICYLFAAGVSFGVGYLKNKRKNKKGKEGTDHGESTNR